MLTHRLSLIGKADEKKKKKKDILAWKIFNLLGRYVRFICDIDRAKPVKLAKLDALYFSIAANRLIDRKPYFTPVSRHALNLVSKVLPIRVTAVLSIYVFYVMLRLPDS